MGAHAQSARRHSQGGRNRVKILRIGVIQGGKIIEEKLLRKRQDVSIGTNPKNTISIPASNLPRTHILFEVKGGRYQLAFSDKMNGRVSMKNGVLDFASLKARNLVKRKANINLLPLTDASRGKVTIGDVTLLFQFVVPPPMPEKPKLPAAARGSLIKTIDWFYAVLLIMSAIFHLGSVVIFYNTPQPEPLGIEELDERWAQLLVPEMKREEKKPEQPKDDAKKGVAASKVAKKSEQDDKPGKELSAEQKAAAREARRAKAKKLIAGRGVLALLGTAGVASTGGVVADVFGQGGIGISQGAFDGITGIGVANGSGERTRRGASDVGTAAGIGDLATSGGGKVATGQKREMKVGVVKSERPEVDGDLDPAAITRYVRARIRSIKDCYERELKRNPDLAGKICIEFTIEESGRVSETYIAINTMGNNSVARCIQRRIKHWVFPKPKGGSVTVTYPFIFTPTG